MNANCTVCHRIGPFMHACLHCVFFACHKHIRDHGVRHNHSVELVYGQIRCFKCNDYVYDTEMEKIAVDNKLIASVFRRRWVRAVKNSHFVVSCLKQTCHFILFYILRKTKFSSE